MHESNEERKAAFGVPCVNPVLKLHLKRVSLCCATVMSLSRRTFAARCAGVLAFSAGLGIAPAGARAPVSVHAVTVSGDAERVRVVLSLDTELTPRTFYLANPERFVIDLPDARWALPEGAVGAGAGAGVVARYRYAQRPQGAGARLVLDLVAPADVDVRAIGRELALTVTPRSPFAGAPALAPRTGRRTVVIDAGHGGHDPGAIGRSGVREKDVVLQAALELRQALMARGGYEVALTREADEFIALEDRVRFARAQSADLFISLHADSHASSAAEGASVYTLSENGAARAQRIAAQQNWDVDLGAAPRSGVVGDILVDLARRETSNRSADFAQTVIESLAPAAPLLRNTHRSAGFFVLLAPDVPAVLIETGFLSNADDERRLADARRRAQMAEAIARAIDAHFTPAQYAART